jgi:hypothetical protein
MNNSEQDADEFIAFCRCLPGFIEADYAMVRKGIVDGTYHYDATDHIVTTPDNWKIQIHSDGRFVPLDES